VSSRIKILEAEEILFRHVHPDRIDKGVPQSTVFAPMPKDEGHLSADSSALTSAAGSHALFVANGFSSAAVYGLSCAQFGAESVDCLYDPLEAGKGLKFANPAHAIADYNPHSKSQWKNIAKRLKVLALKRGCLFPPQEQSSDVSSPG